MSDHHQSHKIRRSQRVKNLKNGGGAEPNIIPSSISISAVAAARPIHVSSSGTTAVTAYTANLSHPAPAQAPVAFVEKDLVVKHEPEDEERQVGTGTKPEILTSGDASNGSHDDADAPNEINNKKKRKHGSKMPIKSEEVDNIDGAYSTNRTRREKRKQYRSEEDSINSSDSHNANTTKNRRVGGRAGGGRRTATDHSTPERTRLKSKQRQEEDNAADETKCCKLCNNSDWENKIYYKCGTVLSKYFPISNNNPNPGWYKGTIQMHHVSSSIFGSDSEYEYEEEADMSSEEESEQQQIIFNEIHYDDGDTENITQDDLKFQVVSGRKVKILHSTLMATTTASECHNLVDNVPTRTVSDNKYDQKWLEKYHRLKQFQSKNSHCRVPKNFGPDPSLGNWVKKQRQHHRKGTLAPDRVQNLNKLGFEWAIVAQTRDQMWQEKYGGLKIYKEENGHCRVPQNYAPDPSLGIWVASQRTIYTKGKMAPDRLEKLNEIGFDWGPFDHAWDEMFGRLEQFKFKNLHCRVPAKYNPDPPLGIWVNTQRTLHKKGKLAEDRVKKLEEIDFDWDPLNQTWDEMFCRLEQFNDENGHCHVPQRHNPDPPLGMWVHRQRKNYKKGIIAPGRIEELNKIGFEWDIQVEAGNEFWSDSCDRLKQFKHENGHCRVPKRYGPDPSLGSWVHNQRTLYKNGKMAPHRVKKLEEIDFEWDS